MAWKFSNTEGLVVVAVIVALVVGAIACRFAFFFRVSGSRAAVA